MKAIGIDPDATGFVCAVVGGEERRVVTKRFSVSTEGLEELVGWVRKEDASIAAIEGVHGQSGPIERALR